MSVYKRGKTWYVEFIQAGVRVKKSAGPAASRASAQALERALRSELAAGQRNPPAHGIDEAFARWLKGEAKGLRDHALASTVGRILPFVAGRSLDEAVDAAEELRAAFRADGLSAGTINRKLSVLRRVCHLAYKWGWTERNEADFIALEKPAPHRDEFMSAEQVEVFAAGVRPEIGRLVRAAFACGARLGELESLRPGDLTVDLDDRNIGWLTIRPGKTGRGRRVPILAHEFGFFDPLPFRFSRQQLKDDWDRVRKKHGLHRFRFHDLRHAYATKLAKAGVGTAQIAALLGHSDLRTAQIYVQRPDENLLAAVRMLTPSGGAGGRGNGSGSGGS